MELVMLCEQLCKRDPRPSTTHHALFQRPTSMQSKD